MLKTNPTAARKTYWIPQRTSQNLPVQLCMCRMRQGPLSVAPQSTLFCMLQVKQVEVSLQRLLHNMEMAVITKQQRLAWRQQKLLQVDACPPEILLTVSPKEKSNLTLCVRVSMCVSMCVCVVINQIDNPWVKLLLYHLLFTVLFSPSHLLITVNADEEKVVWFSLLTGVQTASYSPV